MKIFDDKHLTKKQLRTLLCVFAKRKGVDRVSFNNKGKFVNGTYNALTKIMYVNTNQTKKEMLNTFFHEMGHHEAVKQNRWTNYHFNLMSNLTYEKVFYIENKIDKIGKKLWYKFVDIKQWGRYKYAYPKALKNNIIKHFISNS